jgi:hypothetical protein
VTKKMIYQVLEDLVKNVFTLYKIGVYYVISIN